MINKIRKRFRFYGDVQGVGFRYRCMHAANKFDVTGYVENLYDGSVYAEMQGDSEAIDRTLEILQNSPWIDIKYIDSSEIPLAEHEYSFDIK